MATLNVKIPDEMEGDLAAYLEDHPHYLNKSELVRDALRHLVGEPKLSSSVERKIRAGRPQVTEDEDLVPLGDAR